MNYREALEDIFEKVKGTRELRLFELFDSSYEFQKVMEEPDIKWEHIDDYELDDVGEIQVKKPSGIIESLADRFTDSYELMNFGLRTDSWSLDETGLLLRDVKKEELKLLDGGFDFRVHIYSKEERLGDLMEDRDIDASLELEYQGSTGKRYRKIMDTEKGLLVPDYGAVRNHEWRGENSQAFGQMLVKEQPETLEQLYDTKVRFNDIISEPMYHTLLEEMSKSGQKLMRDYAESIMRGDGDPYR